VSDRLDHGPLVARDQLGGRERVEVVDRPQARQRRIRADAVLGVDDVVDVRRERLAQHRDGALDAGPDVLARLLRERHRPDADGRVDGAVERPVPAAAQRPHVDLGARAGQRLGEGEGVHDTATRLGRVRQQGDPHASVSVSVVR
jgi:hypothetical protein